MRILLAAIYPYVFLLLYLVIPFDDYVRALPNILLLILGIAFPFVVEKSQLQKLKSPPVILLFIMGVYLLLNAFFSGRIADDFDVISKVLTVLGLAILYIPISDMQKIKNAIIFSALAAIFFSVYNFVVIAHETGGFALGDSPQVVDSLLIDRIYLGLLCVFSILISTTSIEKKYHPLNNYYLGNIAINVVFILLIASKIALFALLGLLLLRQFYGSRKPWKFIVVGITGLMLVGFFYVLKNKEFINSKNVPAVVSGFVTNSRTYEIRATAWNCMDEIAKKTNPGLTGIGFENTEKELLDCYAISITDPESQAHFLEQEYNSHNQFLDFYLSAGIISVILFIVFIVGSFLIVYKDYFATAMLALLVYYSLVENVFHRQMGAYYVGVIVIVLLLAATAKHEKTETKTNEFFKNDKKLN